ncbi:MAG: sodium transporter [Calditrichaeota bacterium]|nr:MAG: sodium transporter [Calditrichota bacterium]
MEQNMLHPLDFGVIVISLIVSLAIGAYFSRRQKSTRRYFAAEGSLPSWAIGLSILATLISSVTFLAYPGAGYSSNWILLVQGLMVPVVLVFMVWFIVPLYRDVIGISAYEYFEKRFGFFARLYTSLGFVAAHFSKMGTVFFLLALALASMMGLNTYVVIWIIGITVVLLTVLGGIEAVIWLDVIQGLLLMVGGVLCAIILLFTPPGGPAAVLNFALEQDKIGFAPYDWDFTRLTFFVMAINGIFYAIQKYGTDQTIVQRYLTARSDKDAIRAAMTGVLLCVPVWTLFMFIGTALYAYYNLTGAPLPEGIRADAVFPYFIMTKLPPGITGLIVAALIAAAISSLDSDMNSLAAVGLEDYYLRFRPNCSEKEKLWVGRLLVALSGLAAVGVATFYVKAGNKGVLGVVFTLYAIFSGGIAGLFLLGLFSNRTNKQGAYIGIAACVLFTAWAVLTSTPLPIGGEKRLLLDLGDYNFTHHKYMIGVYSHLVLFFVGYIASFLFPAQEPEKHLTFYGFKEKRDLIRAKLREEAE